MKRKAYHKVDKSDERVFLLLLFIIGIGARFIIGNFCKSMENYNDELRYYSLARSLFNGEGMAIRGVVASFQKIGYSVLLMPLFYIANTRHRVTAITLLNSCLMASSVFGAWLIGNELKLKKKARCFIVIAISIWPDLMISSTFMSENLYWPVFLSFVPFWLKSRNSDKRILAVVCGLVSYIGYLTKEIFLAVVMTCIMFEIVYPLIDNIQLGKNREYEGKNKKNKISLKLYDRNNLAFLFYYLMTFFYVMLH